MARPARKLTVLQIKALTKPGRYGDGDGLFLVVGPTGAGKWVLRVQKDNRRRDIGLGSARHVGLAEAREAATKIRSTLREGRDPVAERKARRAATSLPTFEEAARKVHGEFKAGWRNDKHAAQWLSTLETYAFPTIGKQRVDQLSASEVVGVLSPIWLDKPETARRVRQRIGTVMDWAIAHQHRTAGNPVAAVGKALPKQRDAGGHFSAMPFADLPDFMRRLRAGSDGLADLALEFLILTAARTGEVLGARWSEIDLEAAQWTIPAERMKAGRAHIVPLPERCVAILKRAKELHSGRGDVVFESRPGKAFSNMALAMKLRRMDVATTVHGFRSSFSDWAGETTATPREVVEMALAHTIRDKVEAAYRRGDLLTKRRKLMEAWETFCRGAKGNVVPMARLEAAAV
jgi:integrase